VDSVNSIANPQQAVYLSGQNPVSAAVNPPASDDFVRLVQEEERPYQNAGQTPQYVSPQETGYQDLNRYGQWRQTPDYGPVWAPQVAVGWAPYRDGQHDGMRFARDAILRILAGDYVPEDMVIDREGPQP